MNKEQKSRVKEVLKLLFVAYYVFITIGFIYFYFMVYPYIGSFVD